MKTAFSSSRFRAKTQGVLTADPGGREPPFRGGNRRTGRSSRIENDCRAAAEA
jgi:hypothetical protein